MISLENTRKSLVLPASWMCHLVGSRLEHPQLNQREHGASRRFCQRLAWHPKVIEMDRNGMKRCDSGGLAPFFVLLMWPGRSMEVYRKKTQRERENVPTDGLLRRFPTFCVLAQQQAIGRWRGYTLYRYPTYALDPMPYTR